MSRLSHQQVNALRKVEATCAGATCTVSVFSGSNQPLAGKGSVGAESGNFEVLLRVANGVSQAGFALAATGAGSQVCPVASQGTTVGFSLAQIINSATGVVALTVSTTATTCQFDVFITSGNESIYAGTITG
jgi:hypothetical protein